MLPTHLHLVPMLRVSGAVRLLSLYVFVVLTGTALPFFFFLGAFVKFRKGTVSFVITVLGHGTHY